MRNTPNQGLAGKARRKHIRSRTTRLYHQQLIEDYIHSKNEPAEPPLDRSIPIGHRREFVPTADPNPDDSAAGQLELSLTPIDEDRDAAVIAVPKEEAKALRPTRRDPLHPASRKVADLIAARQKATMPRSVDTSDMNEKSADTFTWRGFAFGCAIGGAAAAVLLVFIRIAFS